MLQADRCDLLQLNDGNQLQISHEWRRDNKIPSSKGTVIPVDPKRLSEQFDPTKPIRINDTAKTKHATLKFFAKALGTRSLLIIPIMKNDEVLAIGLHDTRALRMAGRGSGLSRIDRTPPCDRLPIYELYVAQQSDRGGRMR
jgi:hypothetical protein